MSRARPRLTHADAKGKARMVDVSQKPVTVRRAVAEALVQLPAAAASALRSNILEKGDALGAARLAGVMAAKRTGDLIPLCHPLPLHHVSVAFRWQKSGTVLRIETVATTAARTGVEMEALTAAALAALTIYDMCKGIDKGIVIERIQLLEKTGGKSGAYRARLAAP